MAHHKVRHFRGSVSEDKLIAAGIIKPVEIDYKPIDPILKSIIKALREKLSSLFTDPNEFKALDYIIWMKGNPSDEDIVGRYRFYINLLTAPETDEIDVTPMGGW